MVHARRKAQRQMLVSQAVLVWSTAPAEAIQEFIRSGTLPGSGGAYREPYNEDAVKLLAGVS